MLGETPGFCVLFQLCLTEGAKDECNVVEVVARNHDHQEIAVPVANLKLSCQPMVSSQAYVEVVVAVLVVVVVVIVVVVRN